MARLLPFLLLLLAACGDDSSEGGGIEPPIDDPPPSSEGSRGRLGPLADAGPDQRALPGMRVRLDGRGTRPPEDARATTYRWVQEAGPGVLLSDPTSLVTDFVAPPIRPGVGHRLVFRLTVHDGAAESRDRVAVELVEDPASLEHAPVVVAGADLEAGFGETVRLPTPSFLDPTCLDEGAPSCVHVPLPHCWTQVAGEAVELEGACGDDATTFVAPSHPARLVFRVDAHRRAPDADAAGCGPEGELRATPLCAAPDYLRVVVEGEPRRRTDPTSWWRYRGEEQPRVGLVVMEGPSHELPTHLELTAGASDLGEGWRAISRFRPLLGRLPGSLPREGALRLEAPPWPGPVGVALEPSFYTHRLEGGQARIEWFAGAPAAAVVAWRPPTDLPVLHAEAGGPPCARAPGNAEDCEPLAPGEVGEIVGSVRGQVEGTSPQTCWEQTFGPPVELFPGPGCLPDAPIRQFTAPTPPGDHPVELAFQFTVRDAGPFSSKPSTVWLQVRPDGALPPALAVEAPAKLGPGASATVDASGSVDPAGGPLRFRFRQVGGPAVGLRPCDVTAESQSGCTLISAPLDAATGTVALHLQVASAASGLVTTRTIEIPIEEGAEG